MKSIIIYHSITGNTKKIAQAIHHGINKAGESCDIARLKEITTGDLTDYDLIGLGSPVMWQRELHNVTEFIEYTMKNVTGKNGFAFCTHGAMPAHYFSRVVPALMQQGLTIIGWNDWFGSASFPCIPKPYFTDGHPDEIDLKEAEDFGMKMADLSRKIYSGNTQLIPVFPRGCDYNEIYDPVNFKAPEEERKALEKSFANALTTSFRVNKEKCKYPKCTFCIDSCPMEAIDFSVSPPIFNKNCDRCFMCEMACPQGAIEFDYEPFHKVHNVRPGDNPLTKSLDVFEARGKFRRLVPMDKIGWDTPFWKFKKPRYKIV